MLAQSKFTDGTFDISGAHTMANPKKPLYYRIRDMAPYILSGDYRDTWIINPYDECFELDLLLNQLCFHYSFANRQVKPGLNVIFILSSTLPQTIRAANGGHRWFHPLS